MVEKREHDTNGDAAPDPKRHRGDAAAAPVKPAINLEAIQKARALLEKQKQLQEKLKKLPQVSKPPPAPGAAAAAAAAGAAPSAAPAPVAVANPSVLAAAAVAAQRAAEIASRFGVQASLPGLHQVQGATGLGASALPAAVGAPAAQPRFQPPPLRLDAQGKEVDEFGNAVPTRAQAVTSLLVNQRTHDAEAAAAALEEAEAAAAAAPVRDDRDFFDERMGDSALRRLQRRPRNFEFVQEGSFQKAAELMRLRQRYGDAAGKRGQRPTAAGPADDPNTVPIGAGGGPLAAALAGAAPVGDANLVPIGQKVASKEDELRASLPEGRDTVPAVEWWDRPLLVGGSYEGAASARAVDGVGEGGAGSPPRSPGDSPRAGGADDGAGASDGVGPAIDGGGGGPQLRLQRITHLVEHPVPIEPPAEAAPPPPQPLKLTARELKKLRTQRRQAREKEKQELIRQGLLEPPKPKVRISNLMRVLGAEATADPTAIEKEVRSQMAERQAAHDDRNLARMLTPSERKEKKLGKMFDDTGLEVYAAVYRVADLSFGQHRFKVDVNAKENHLSGVMLTGPAFSLVLVEGCRKSLKRYHKLMLRRIDWNERGDDGAAAEDGDAGEDVNAERPPNTCDLVWEGLVKEAAFKDFSRREVAVDAAARKVLEDHGVAHYWDAAANLQPGSGLRPADV